MDKEKDYKYYTSLGIEQTNQQNFEKALEYFEKSLELNDKSALTYFSKGIAYHNLNQLQAALENYSKAIEIDSGMTDAYFNRAQAILSYEEPEECELQDALSDFQKAVQLDKGFADAYFYAAVVQKKLGLYKEAVDSLDKVIELEPMAVHSKALKKLILQKYLK